MTYWMIEWKQNWSWPSMADSKQKNPVIELFSVFDSQEASGVSFSCASLFTLSDTETLIYVGTHCGKLLLLSANPNPPSSSSISASHISDSVPRNLSLLNSTSVNGSSVQSVHIISEAEKILVLSSGSLFLFDLFLRFPVRKLRFPKGVNFVARRFHSDSIEFSGLHRIHVDVTTEPLTPGRRLLQRLGAGGRPDGAATQDFEPPLNSGHLLALAFGRRLIVAELVFSGLDLGDSDSDRLDTSLITRKEFMIADGIKNMVWMCDSIIVGTESGYSLVHSRTAQISVLFFLPYPSSLPKLKLLHKENNVLLVVDNVGVIVDGTGNPVGGSINFQSAPESVGETRSCILTLKEGRVETYQKKSGDNVQVILFSKEGVDNCTIAEADDGDGILIVVLTPAKVICFRNIPNEEKIRDLLRKKSFNEAIDLVGELESEGELTGEARSFVHAQLGFLLLFDLRFEDAVNHFLKSEIMQPYEIFPFIMPDPNPWSFLVPRNRYWGLHPPPVPLEVVIDDGLSAMQRDNFLRKAGLEKLPDDDFLLNAPNKTELLEVAIKSMIRYLVVSRMKQLTTVVREGVDTVLMYLYRTMNQVDDMEKLVSSANNCIVEELEPLLEDSVYSQTLALLYSSNGMSPKALSVWRTLAKSYKSGLKHHPESEKGVLGETIAATEAAKILEKSSDQHLILQHLGWIADIDQFLAIRVLTSDKRDDQLSPDEVVTAIDLKKVEMLQRYLEWLIEDQGCDDIHLHTLYALSLAKSTIESVESLNCSESDCCPEKNFSTQTNLLRKKLQTFLESDFYDPEEVLDLVEGSNLWSEKAIIYKKLGQEVLVLQILALKLDDCDAAEKYCAEIGRADAYMQLLDIYLDPQNGKEPMFNAAVRLLHNHGEAFDPLQVLETLSSDMPLQLASETISRMLKARLRHRRQGLIAHSLSRMVDLDARVARLEERSRHVHINEDTVCDSCRSRLGTKLFAMCPDDSVVCYKCFCRLEESTFITGRDFEKYGVFKPGWLVGG